MKKNIQMIILCGGKGRRMGRLTQKIPKPLIKVGKKSILEHKIDYYKSQKIQNFIFCLGYKYRLIEKFLQKKKVKSEIVNSGINAGILKRIYSTKKFLKNNVLISYGDTLAQINFNSLVRSHENSKRLMTLVAAPIQNPFGLLSWNKKKLVTDFNEKPILNHFIGYAVLNPNIFKILSKNIINMPDGKGMIEAIKFLIKKKQVNIYTFEDLQVTINSPEELQNAKLNYKKYFTLNEKFKK
tara:strand:+ start:4590 stop:5309 length:720 start_codon:yes stop_codon:yes gene_type:complete